jgi:hypothetical protein
MSSTWSGLLSEVSRWDEKDHEAGSGWKSQKIGKPSHDAKIAAHVCSRQITRTEYDKTEV